MAVTTDPTEAGTPIAADFPGAGAAVGSFTTGAAATADFGEADGVTAGEPAGEIDNLQLEAAGAETLQAAGRERALVTLRTTPN